MPNTSNSPPEKTPAPAIRAYLGGSFDPVHKGHLEVALDAASRNYITNLTIIIGKGVRDGINAEQSKAIWDIYLNRQTISFGKIYYSFKKC